MSDHEQTVIAYATWETSHQLKLTLYYIGTPYVVTYLLAFLDDKTLELQFHINVSLNIPNFTADGALIPRSFSVS